MSVVTVTPSSEVFTWVPELSYVVKQFNKQDIPRLIRSVGGLFVRHEVHNIFGLSMVHRHFDVKLNEILVETLSNDSTMSVAMPWNVSGSITTPAEEDLWTSFSLKTKKYVVPRNWVFNESGGLLPFEYISVDDKDAIIMPTMSFAQELFAALKQMGVERYVGIMRLPHRSIPSWETTPAGSRGNVTVFGEQPPDDVQEEDMVQVLWKFDQNGQVTDGGMHCKQHIIHCYKH